MYDLKEGKGVLRRSAKKYYVWRRSAVGAEGEKKPCEPGDDLGGKKKRSSLGLKGEWWL